MAPALLIRQNQEKPEKNLNWSAAGSSARTSLPPLACALQQLWESNRLVQIRLKPVAEARQRKRKKLLYPTAIQGGIG